MTAPKLTAERLKRLRDIADHDRWFVEDCADLRALLADHAALQRERAKFVRVRVRDVLRERKARK